MKIDFKGMDKNEVILLIDYIENFNIHYDLLLRRYERFKEINYLGNSDIDVITYFDMVVVQLRAMCIESEWYKKNYTAQILLRKIGEGELAEKLDSVLDEEFFQWTSGFTIRKGLKELADQFICHYDNFDGKNKDGWAMASIIEKELKNPYAGKNLDYIMNKIVECIGTGLSLEHFSIEE